jgi:hypothetical protein
VILPVKFPQFFTGVYPSLSLSLSLSLSRVWKPPIGHSLGLGVFMSSHALSKFALEIFR